MKKEIKFSLVFRDMWQSAGKYVPRVDQLVKVAPAIMTGQNLSTKPVYKLICSIVLSTDFA